MKALNNESKNNVAEFKNIIEHIFGDYISIEDVGKSVRLKLSDRHLETEPTTWEVTKEDIQQYFSELGEMSTPRESETVLFNEYTYEITVRIPSKNLLLFTDLGEINEEPLTVEDSLNRITYKLGRPSEMYLLYVLKILYEKGFSQNFLHSFVIRRLFWRNRDKDFFYVLLRVLPVRYTVKIISDNAKSLTQFENLSESFFIHIKL